MAVGSTPIAPGSRAGFPDWGPGFTHLDVELARLAWRVAPQTPAVILQAVAIVSRAQACGHTAVDLSMPADELLDLIEPASGSGEGPGDISAASAFEAMLCRWLTDIHRALPEGHGPADVLAGGSTGGEASGEPGNRPGPDPVIACARDEQGFCSAAGTSLLVWDPPRLYLRRAWDSERRVAKALQDRLRAHHAHGVHLGPVDGPADPRVHAQDLLKQWLPSTPESPTEDQQQACLQALGGRLTVITGGPGSGKTHTAARLLALLQACRPDPDRPLRIALATPTGKAAARLRQALQAALAALQALPAAPQAGLPPSFWDELPKSIAPPSTLHALLGLSAQGGSGRPSGGAELSPWSSTVRRTVLKVAAADVVLIDEASMMDLSLAEALLTRVNPSSRLILIGDRRQLASVEAGSVLADLVDGLWAQGAVSSLGRSRRFGGSIGRCAEAVLQGDAAALAALLADADADVDAPLRCGPLGGRELIDLALGPQGYGPLWHHLNLIRNQSIDDNELIDLLKAMDEFRMLCAIRQGPWGVQGCNEAIERELLRRGWGKPSAGAAGAPSHWYHGRMVMVTRNQPAVGLHNGDVGLVLHGPPGSAPRMVWLQGEQVRSVPCSRLSDVETAWAMTVHKSQGSEFSRVALILPAGGPAQRPQVAPPALTRELLYTGITRARRGLWIVGHPDGVVAASRRPTRRMGGLAAALQSGVSAVRPAAASRPTPPAAAG